MIGNTIILKDNSRLVMETQEVLDDNRPIAGCDKYPDEFFFHYLFTNNYTIAQYNSTFAKK